MNHIQLQTAQELERKYWEIQREYNQWKDGRAFRELILSREPYGQLVSGPLLILYPNEYLDFDVVKEMALKNISIELEKRKKAFEDFKI